MMLEYLENHFMYFCGKCADRQNCGVTVINICSSLGR